MQEVRDEFTTSKSVDECVQAFRQGVKSSYGGGRKLLRAAASLRGGGEGVEYYEPHGGSAGGHPDAAIGAWVPGMNMLNGATRMAVHCYVVDKGTQRLVQLVGPHRMGEKGSTQRLMATVRAAF